MNIKKYYFISIIGLVGVIMILYYYLYFPRYSLGYGNIRVSKAVWDFAMSGSSDSFTGLYYKRLLNDYNYKAYILYRYYDFVVFMRGKYQPPLHHQNCIERIIDGEINVNDKQVIDMLEVAYRMLFLESLATYQPKDKEKQYFIQHLLAFYFIVYYNHAYNGFGMNESEITNIVNWINKNNNDIEIKNIDPLGLRQSDFTIMQNEKMLRNYFSISVDAEWIRNIKLYEQVCEEYQIFLRNKIKSLSSHDQAE